MHETIEKQVRAEGREDGDNWDETKREKEKRAKNGSTKATDAANEVDESGNGETSTTPEAQGREYSRIETRQTERRMTRQQRQDKWQSLLPEECRQSPLMRPPLLPKRLVGEMMARQC
jgi:hypothetical protein